MEPSQAGHIAKGRKEFKDEQLFARLIGAAVLLALAVIVLPFVLDGSGSQREYEYAETLPVEPPKPVVEKSFSSRQPVVQAPARETVEVRVPEPTSTADLQAPSVAPTSASPDQGSAQQAGVIRETNRLNTEQLASAVAAAASGDSGVLGSTPVQAGWNIQVASFVRDANATKLLNKLRAQNLPGYANRVAGKTRSVIRVLVGPYGNQIDALALQNRINREYQVESLMVKR